MSKGLHILAILCLISCNQPDLAADEKAIRELLKKEQQAHLEKNIDLLLSNGTPETIVVNRGIVSVPTEEQNRARFTHYFGSVNFIKWEDTADPIIRFSDDSSLAYAIIQKQVILTLKDDVTAKPDTTDFAWMSVWRKMDGKWKMESIVSTNKP